MRYSSNDNDRLLNRTGASQVEAMVGAVLLQGGEQQALDLLAR